MAPETKAVIVLCLLAGLALALPWLAWIRLRRLERKYGNILLVRGISGAQAARVILLRGEIPQVGVDETTVALNDYYSAFEPAIKLSPDVYHGKRLFDVARAARLAGHALQHRDRKLGNLASWDSFMILWGNAWPVILVLSLTSKGRSFIYILIAFSILSGVLTLAHSLKHNLVTDAARRGRQELEAAQLLEGHPAKEIEAAFLCARLEHLALPYSRTWWRLLFSR